MPFTDLHVPPTPRGMEDERRRRRGTPTARGGVGMVLFHCREEGALCFMARPAVVVGGGDVGGAADVVGGGGGSVDR